MRWPRLRSPLSFPGQPQQQQIRPTEEERTGDPLPFGQWVSYFTFGGINYPFFMPPTTMQGSHEHIANDFMGYVQAAYRSNGPIFALMLFRMLTFSDARFQWRRLLNGRPGDLFGTQDLKVVENPFGGSSTTGDLLRRAIQDADIAGNFYGVRRNNQIRRIRPDWMTIVMASDDDVPPEEFVPGGPDTVLLGYIYQQHGYGSGAKPEVFLPEEVCHWAPVPDPLATYRGMSWLTPVLRELMSDNAETNHKLKFFENGATVNQVVTLDPTIQQREFKEWITAFEARHRGAANAYRTLYLGAGAKLTPIGANFQQMDFKVVQGAGETRLAAAAQVPPILAGFSEGLQSATYSNYQLARRRYADATLRPLWRDFAGSMQNILNAPGGAQLWYDDRDIPFLRDDAQDRATIQGTQATTISTLITSGFTPDSAVKAVGAEDFSLLKHTGLYSVQLQPPGELGEPGGPPVGGGNANQLPPGPAASNPTATPNQPPKPAAAPPKQPVGAKAGGNGNSPEV